MGILKVFEKSKFRAGDKVKITSLWEDKQKGPLFFCKKEDLNVPLTVLCIDGSSYRIRLTNGNCQYLDEEYLETWTTPHKHAEVIKAWADGAEIEYKSEFFGGEKWFKAWNPTWNLNIAYRVKPVMEYQVVYRVGEHNYLTHQWYTSKEEFDNFYIPVKGEAKFICFVKATGRERSSIK